MDWRHNAGFIESVVQSSDALIAVLDRNGRIVFFNRSCERATGYTLAQVRGRLIWRLLIVPHERRSVRSLFKQIVQGQYPQRYENDWLTRDADRIRVSWANTALTDETGEVTLVVATGTDVTQQRRTEDDLRRISDRAHALFESASQAILAVEPDGRISSANSAALKVFGYGRDELLDLPLESLLPSRFRNKHTKLRAGFFSHPQRRPMGPGLELRALRKDGHEFPIEVGLSHVDSIDGRVAVAFISDISERVAAQAKAEAAGRRVQDLAGKLMIAQEEERRSIARDLHDDFTHRLAVLGLELGFLRKELESGHAEWAKRVHRLQDETLTLTDEARRLSHELHPAALEHCGLVTALDAQCREFSKSSGVDVDFMARNAAASVPREIASPLYRITQEAVRNALRHAHARKIRVYLSRDSEALQLSVVDDGLGFDLEKVRAEGAGVGLTSIEERARQIGGEFAVRSIPGEGSRIEIRVPLPAAAPNE